jgi:hypothetical protein
MIVLAVALGGAALASFGPMAVLALAALVVLIGRR